MGSNLLAAPGSTTKDGSITPETRQAVLEAASHHFPPELINRLDAQIVFNRLNRRNIADIVSLRLNDIQERLKERRMTLDVNEAAKEVLAERGYDDVYGARAITRVVRQRVVNPLAEKLLEGTIRCVDFLSFSIRRGNPSL